MEQWRITLQTFLAGDSGIVSTRTLRILRDALGVDDPRLIQSCVALPLQPDLPPEAACLVGFVGWVERGYETTREIEDHFSRVAALLDREAPDATAAFLVWFDESPREVVLAEVLAAVERELAERGAVVKV